MVALITGSSLDYHPRLANSGLHSPPDLRLVRGGLDVSERDRSALFAVAAVVSILLGVIGLRMVQGQPPTDLLGGSEVVSSSVAAADSSEAVHVVAQGDTLWAIAELLAPGRDPRPIVDALADRNGGTALRAGDLLVIPAELVAGQSAVGLAVGPLGQAAP